MDRAALVAHARASMRRGSRSFALASRLFDRTTRERVWLLYAWCRACDDLIDGQDYGGDMVKRSDARGRLANMRRLTAAALAGEETGDPSFDCFRIVAQECGITVGMAEDVIAGFALDAADWRPRSEVDLLLYCYHVAGAIGVMMAAVMGVQPGEEDTLDRACDLGIAFQLANIARDIGQDDAANRCYLPIEWLVEADIPPGEQMKPHYRHALLRLVRRLCGMQRAYEASARVGAGRLTFRQRWAVFAAAGIHGAIAREVALAGEHAWDHRIVTSRFAKLGHVLRALWEAATPPPKTAERPQWSRRELADRARRNAALYIGQKIYEA